MRKLISAAAAAFLIHGAAHAETVRSLMWNDPAKTIRDGACAAIPDKTVADAKASISEQLPGVTWKDADEAASRGDFNGGHVLITTNPDLCATVLRMLANRGYLLVNQ